MDKLKSINTILNNMGIDTPNFNMDTNLIDELGIDSTEKTELVLLLEKEFGVDLDKKSITTVRDIFKAIELKESNLCQ